MFIFYKNQLEKAMAIKKQPVCPVIEAFFKTQKPWPTLAVREIKQKQ
jgi:hypothetical protein